MQSGAFNDGHPNNHPFTAIAFEPAVPTAAVVPEMPTPPPTTNGKPREPPRKKRGRPRDSKPAFTFRVEKQRVDTRASRHQQTNNIKGKNRNGSLTFQTQRLLPQPLIPQQPAIPQPEPSAVALSNGGRPFAPGSPETLAVHQSQYHARSPLLPDDGSGWPRNFSGPPHHSPVQMPVYGRMPSLPLPPRPLPLPPHLAMDPFANVSGEQRFYLGSGRWAAGPPPEVEEAVSIAARVPVLASTAPGAVNEQLFQPPPYPGGDRGMPFLPQGGNTGY